MKSHLCAARKSEGEEESERPCEAKHASDTEDEDQKKDKVDRSAPPKTNYNFANASSFVQYPGENLKFCLHPPRHKKMHLAQI